MMQSTPFGSTPSTPQLFPPPVHDEPLHVAVLHGGDYHRRQLTASKIQDVYPHPLPIARQDRSVHHPSVRALMEAMDHVTVVASYNPYSRTAPIEHHIVPRTDPLDNNNAPQQHAEGNVSTTSAFSAQESPLILPPSKSLVHKNATTTNNIFVSVGPPLDNNEESVDSANTTASTTPLRAHHDGLSSDEDECVTPPNTPSSAFPSDASSLPASMSSATAPSALQRPIVLDCHHHLVAACPTSPTAPAVPRVGRLYYFVAPTLFPDYCVFEDSNPSSTPASNAAAPATTALLHRRIVFGSRCSIELAHLPRYKLGGLCCEIEDVVVAHILFMATGVIVAGADMFTNCKGCCSVWLRSEADAQKLRDGVHQRLWTLPTQLGYCLLSKNAEGRRFLEDQIQRISSPFAHLRFPRHMVTVQRYIDLPEHRPTRSSNNGSSKKHSSKNTNDK
ncbi:Hypothetical protein, putative [Bodo saltans]|uniref:Uncharacterized protein n=1 Tax=Bodo saltans TaxID=75058 RepID=A0A0S4IKW1_BODSA|nr:Hypothetical protein, putative [Bodo saltans]|eukprot:CUE66703.1 Hypothetical protein, putative [Bodo saltans]